MRTGVRTMPVLAASMALAASRRGPSMSRVDAAPQGLAIHGLRV